MTMRKFLIMLAFLLGQAATAAATDLHAVARLLPDSRITGAADAPLSVELSMTQAVPFRIFHLADPYRVVLDFNELDFAAADMQAIAQSEHVLALRAGRFRPGWSRLVVELDGPLLLEEAQISSENGPAARLRARFSPVDDAAFRASAGAPADSTLPAPAPVPDMAEPDDGLIRVVIDPGHGGIDPGAQVEGHVEADLMLSFARELKEALLRTGGFEVVLTREADEFVSLERRVRIAHANRADLFISLHADIVLEGRASGLTIYTLDEDASDAASRKLAERHDRGDILAGVDLTAKSDTVARVLMDLARNETAHRTDRLAETLVEELGKHVELYKRPILSAGFSVLKSADIPSVLIELGFLNSPRDMANIADAKWRADAVAGIVSGIVAWARNDAAERELRRK